MDDIVAEGVLDKCKGILCDTGDELGSLISGRVVNATLQDATTMAVCANNDTVLADCVIDEFGILGPKAIEAFLDDMVAIQVLD